MGAGPYEYDCIKPQYQSMPNVLNWVILQRTAAFFCTSTLQVMNKPSGWVVLTWQLRYKFILMHWPGPRVPSIWLLNSVKLHFTSVKSIFVGTWQFVSQCRNGIIDRNIGGRQPFRTKKWKQSTSVLDWSAKWRNGPCWKTRAYRAFLLRARACVCVCVCVQRFVRFLLI